MEKAKNKGVLIIENYLPDLYKSRIPLGEYLNNKDFDIYYASPGRHEYLQLSLKNRSNFSIVETLQNIMLLHLFIRKNSIKYILPFRHHSNIYAFVLSLLNSQLIIYPTVTGLGNVYNNDKKVGFRARILTLMYREYSKKREIIVQNNDIPRILKVDNYLLVNGSGVPDPEYGRPCQGNKINFVYAGRLLRSKGVLKSAELIGGLYKLGKDVEFRIYGDIDQENSASLSKEELSYLQNLPFVKMCGHVNDKEQIFADSNIAILMSEYNEGLSRFLIEALAHKLAVITSDRAGCRELAMHGNGVHISTDDGFLEFFDKPFNLKDMGQKSYSAFKHYYEDSIIFSKYIELLLK